MTDFQNVYELLVGTKSHPGLLPSNEYYSLPKERALKTFSFDGMSSLQHAVFLKKKRKGPITLSASNTSQNMHFLIVCLNLVLGQLTVLFK